MSGVLSRRGEEVARRCWVSLRLQASLLLPVHAFSRFTYTSSFAWLPVCRARCMSVVYSLSVGRQAFTSSSFLSKLRLVLHSSCSPSSHPQAPPPLPQKTVEPLSFSPSFGPAFDVPFYPLSAYPNCPPLLHGLPRMPVRSREIEEQRRRALEAASLAQAAAGIPVSRGVQSQANKAEAAKEEEERGTPATTAPTEEAKDSSKGACFDQVSFLWPSALHSGVFSVLFVYPGGYRRRSPCPCSSCIHTGGYTPSVL